MSIFRRKKQDIVSEYKSEQLVLGSPVKRKTKFGKLPGYARALIIVFSVIIVISGSAADFHPIGSRAGTHVLCASAGRREVRRIAQRHSLLRGISRKECTET